MDSPAIPVEFNSEADGLSDQLREKTLERLQELSADHTDIVGAAVSLRIQGCSLHASRPGRCLREGRQCADRHDGRAGGPQAPGSRETHQTQGAMEAP
jgi:hypothetical protein